MKLRTGVFVLLFFSGLLSLKNLKAQESSAQENSEVQEVSPSSSSSSSSSSSDSNQSLPFRPKVTDELNKESSSFIGDPDSLDPLPLKKESLKEDEEPLFEDIKSIIDNKEKLLNPKPQKPKKVLIKKKTKVQELKVQEQIQPSVQVERLPQPVLEEVQVPKSEPIIEAPVADIKPKNKIKQSSQELSSRSEDDPDLKLEESFFKTYLKFNQNPTPDEVWVPLSSKAPQVYKVQKGDTLFDISRILFDDSQFWPKIWSINSKITNPHIIKPGSEINFYPGDSEAAPALKVTDPVIKVEDPVINPEDPEGPKIRSLVKQNTEYDKKTSFSKTKKEKVQPIPPSLPLFNSTSTLNDRTEIIFTPRLDLKDKIPVNPYIITSDSLVADFKVSKVDADQFICRDGQYIEKTTRVVADAASGSYFLVVNEDYKLNKLQKSHVYKIIGEATINDDKTLRIKKCIDILNSEILIVSQNKLNQLGPVTESNASELLKIIDGLDVYAQKFYTLNQYVILNIENQRIEEGNNYLIYSDHAGQSVGEVKVLKKSGTVALGYIIKADDLIEDGDRVILPE